MTRVRFFFTAPLLALLGLVLPAPAAMAHFDAASAVTMLGLSEMTASRLLARAPVHDEFSGVPLALSPTQPTASAGVATASGLILVLEDEPAAPADEAADLREIDDYENYRDDDGYSYDSDSFDDPYDNDGAYDDELESEYDESNYDYEDAYSYDDAYDSEYGYGSNDDAEDYDYEGNYDYEANQGRYDGAYRSGPELSDDAPEVSEEAISVGQLTAWADALWNRAELTDMLRSAVQWKERAGREIGAWVQRAEQLAAEMQIQSADLSPETVASDVQESEAYEYEFEYDDDSYQYDPYGQWPYGYEDSYGQRDFYLEEPLAPVTPDAPQAQVPGPPEPIVFRPDRHVMLGLAQTLDQVGITLRQISRKLASAAGADESIPSAVQAERPASLR